MNEKKKARLIKRARVETLIRELTVQLQAVEEREDQIFADVVHNATVESFEAYLRKLEQLAVKSLVLKQLIVKLKAEKKNLREWWDRSIL
jgi:adenine-specific DNA methylase